MRAALSARGEALDHGAAVHETAVPRRTTPGADRSARRRARHAAAGSRLLAAGIGAGATFGLMSLIGSATASSGAPTQPVEPVIAPVRPVQIVVHQVPVAQATHSSARPDPAPAPVPLTAETVVRTVVVPAPAGTGAGGAVASGTAPPAQARPQPAPQAQQPVATTHGSR